MRTSDKSKQVRDSNSKGTLTFTFKCALKIFKDRGVQCFWILPPQETRLFPKYVRLQKKTIMAGQLGFDKASLRETNG